MFRKAIIRASERTPKRLVVYFSQMGYVKKQAMDALLGINHTQLRSIRCRKGAFRRV